MVLNMAAIMPIAFVLSLSALHYAEATAAVRGPVQYQKQTDYGTYKFGYDTGDEGGHSFRQEHRGFDGVVHGRYGYTDADGKLRYVEYSAGPDGYKVKGDTGPDHNAAKIKEGYKVPSDVELADLNTGLAKIQRDQLFGVPVTPYIKGYTHGEAKVPVAPQHVVVVKQPPPPPVVVVRPQPPPVRQVVVVPQPPPAKSIFVEHAVQQPKSYVPPIPVQVIPQVQTIVHPPQEIRVNPVRPVIFEQHPPYTGVKVVHRPLPQVFEKRVTVPYQQKGYVHVPEVRVVTQRPYLFQKPVEDHYTKGYVVVQPTPAPVVRVVPPRPVQVVYQKGYVHPTPAPAVVRVVPSKGYVPPVQVVYQKGYVHPTPAPAVVRVVPSKAYVPPVQVVYQKGYVHPTPAPAVYRVVPPKPVQVVYRKGYVHPAPAPVVRVEPPVQVPYQKGYVHPTQAPTIIYRVEQSPKSGYVKGYVATPRPVVVRLPEEHYTRVAAPCVKCGSRSQKGYFPHQKVSREYVFARPVQPFVKGYTGGRGRGVTSSRDSYRRSYTQGRSVSGGNDGLTWIPAPQQRYRAETQQYEEPPPYAYTAY